MASIASDIRKTAWGLTLMLNLMRSAAAGLVFMCILIVGMLVEGTTSPENFVFAITYPLAWPICYLIFLLPLGLLALGLAKTDVPFAGLFAVFCSLAVAVGDPILWVLNKLFPRRLPIVRSIYFRLFNFSLVVLVLKSVEAGRCRSCNHEVSPLAAKCPFCGEPDPWEVQTAEHFA